VSVPARSLPHPAGRPPLRPLPAPPRRRRRGAVAFALVTSLLVAAMVLGLVVLNVMVSESSFRLDELSHRVARLERRVEIRRLEAARLSAPDRIARQARRLGLVVPDPRSVVHLQAPARPEGG
jgi:hypothetical protein